MRIKFVGPTTIGLAVALVVASSTSAASALDSTSELSATVTEAAEIASAAPDSPVALDASVGEATTEHENASVVIPFDVDEPIQVVNNAADNESQSPSFSIDLPENASGQTEGKIEGSNSVIFEGDEAHSVVQTFQDSLRIATIIEEAKASKSYTYTLPDDVLPVIKADGSVALESTFVNPDAPDEFVTISHGKIAKPWAVDAAGVAVPTHYEVSQGQLTQVVEHTADNAFPVTADPTYWWGWNMFISNSLHKRAVDMMATGATVVAIANLFVAYIPNPYVQLAIRLASAIFLAGFVIFKTCNVNGRGVILGQVTVLNWVPPLGPFGWIRNGFFCLPQ